jgi:alkylhydroperoxidase family enzyme
MTRIPLVDPDDPNLDGATRGLLQGARAAAGRDYNIYRAIANHPQVLEGFAHFGASAYFLSSLPPAQRELAYLSASVANDCHY